MVGVDPTEKLRQFIDVDDLKQWWAVTLTMKQGVEGEYLDQIKSSQNFTHFMNLLNKSVFGNAHRRFGKRLEVVPALEWSPDNRLHYHIAIRNPWLSDPLRFDMLIRECWTKTQWGYREIKIEHCINGGWIDYMIKQKSTNEIDWENYYRV